MDNPAFRWRDVDIGGRRAEVFEPSASPAAAVIWLHDLDERSFRGRAAVEQSLAEENIAVICPPGGRRWWLDLPAGEGEESGSPVRQLLDEALPWISVNWNLAPPRVGLLGLGMGGGGAVNIAFRHARRFPVVVAMLPDIDFHEWYGQGYGVERLFESREAARQQTATLHLHPLNWPRHLLLACDRADPRFDGVERLASKLISSGIPFEVDFETGGSGDPWSYVDRIIAPVARFLGKHLQNALE